MRHTIPFHPLKPNQIIHRHFKHLRPNNPLQRLADNFDIVIKPAVRWAVGLLLYVRAVSSAGDEFFFVVGFLAIIQSADFHGGAPVDEGFGGAWGAVPAVEFRVVHIRQPQDGDARVGFQRVGDEVEQGFLVEGRDVVVLFFLIRQYVQVKIFHDLLMRGVVAVGERDGAGGGVQV